MGNAGNAFDLVVVGLGAMGAAALYHARRQGLRVLGIDRHRPPHELGSTHAETRITRLAVGEGAPYLPFVRRSHELWRDLEARSGEQLLHQSGGLIVTGPGSRPGARWADFTSATARIAREAGIGFDLLDASTATARYPAIVGLDRHQVGFEPTGGIVMAERALSVQLTLAEADGAIVHTDETVDDVVPGGDHVDVVTDRDSYRSRHVVLSTGPWVRELADPSDGALTSVTRQVVYWFEVDDPDAFTIERFPFVMWIGASDAEYLGVFPIPPGGTSALKVLGEQFESTTDPETVDRTVSPSEIDAFYEHCVEPRIAGVNRRCVRATVCLYTNTPDDHFLIDSDPRSDHITVMSPCSGHGFKHSAALGEAVAERVATGTSTLDLDPFRRRRFAV